MAINQYCDENINGDLTVTGDVGIGTTSPSRKLEVAGDVGIDGYIYHNGDDSKIGFEGNDAIRMYTANSVRMQVNSSGDVGIGTTSPSYKLEVNGTLGVSRTDGIIFAGSVGSGQGNKITSDVNNNLIFSTSLTSVPYTTTERIRILNDGKVGIGTTSPSYELDVDGVIRGEQYLRLRDTGGTNRFSVRSETTYSTIDNGTNALNYIANTHAFLRSSTEIMRIHSNNNVGIGTTSPSYKLDVSGTGRFTSYLSFNDQGYIRGDVSGELRLQGGSTATTFYNSSNSSELMRITQAGDVGIGTNSPTATLHVNGDDFKVTNGNESSLTVDTTQYEYKLGDISGGEQQSYLGIESANSKAYFVNCDLGIGTFAPSAKLHVQGNSNFIGAINGYTGSTSNRYLSILQSGGLTYLSTGTTNETIYFGIGPVSNTTNINCTGTATATNFILSSDERLKKNIKDLEPKAIDVKWKSFELKLEPDYKRVGVIAQELEKTNPEFIREDVDGTKSVAYIDLLITKIAELEARLEKAGL